MIKNLVMSVGGMKDAKSERQVLSAVGNLEGVHGVAVDMPCNLVAVSLDDAGVCESKVRHAISKQGFTVT